MEKDRFSIDMKKIFCFLFLLIIANLAAKAQDPEFSFNKLTHGIVNPGFAGSEEGVNGLILNRYQWSGFDGAPKTLVFSVASQARLFGAESGIGLNIMSDEIGFMRDISISFDYAYRTSTSLGDLGIGASLGFRSQTIDGDWTAPENSGGTRWDTSDPIVPQGEVSNLAWDLGMGLFLKSKDYFIGASVTHINQAEMTDDEEDTFYYLARHYYLHGGYNISMPDPLFVLQPSVLLKTDLANMQIDLNAEIIYNDKISGALNYRLNDGFGAQFKYELPNGIKAGIAFDFVTSAMGRYGFVSQELFVSYSFDLGKGRSRKYKSVRFL